MTEKISSAVHSPDRLPRWARAVLNPDERFAQLVNVRAELPLLHAFLIAIIGEQAAMSAHQYALDKDLLSMLPVFVGPMLATTVAFPFFVRRSARNTHSFGPYLTVRKVSPLLSDFAAVFPEAKAFSYIGRMHFFGPNNDPDHFEFQNQFRTARGGFRGLAELARACERQEPWLNGVEAFGGVGRVITPKFEKWGFQVVAKPPFPRDIFSREYKFITMLDSLTDKAVSSVRRRLRREPNPPDMPKLDTPVTVAMIRREDLIGAQNDFSRLAGYRTG